MKSHHLPIWAFFAILIFNACGPVVNPEFYSVKRGAFFNAEKIILPNSSKMGFDTLEENDRVTIEKDNRYFAFHKNTHFYMAQLNDDTLTNLQLISAFMPATMFFEGSTESPNGVFVFSYQPHPDSTWQMRTFDGRKIFDGDSFILQRPHEAVISGDSIEVRGVLNGKNWKKHIANRADFKPTNSAKGGGPLGDLPD